MHEQHTIPDEPGWYADPFGDGYVRWWNGTSWEGPSRRMPEDGMLPSPLSAAAPPRYDGRGKVALALLVTAVVLAFIPVIGIVSIVLIPAGFFLGIVSGVTAFRERRSAMFSWLAVGFGFVLMVSLSLTALHVSGVA